MTKFDKSNWARPEFSRGYRENADIFIVDRQRMLSILQSFYLHFVGNGRPIKMLDLGCGDGVVTSAIAEVYPDISAVLVDGSADMLRKAKERLRHLRSAKYVRASFQKLIGKKQVKSKFDFAASSLAIHHLTLPEKEALFAEISSLLNPGGHFVNIDVVLAPTGPLEQWYLSAWKDRIDEQRWNMSVTSGAIGDIVRRYKEAEENKPDTLQDQMTALERIGFRDVDCYYKNGIFTMFGGRK